MVDYVIVYLGTKTALLPWPADTTSIEGCMVA